MSIDFPKKDRFYDFEGKEREFGYLIHETGTGFSVMAKETKEIGYVFHAFSETNPFNALGELRQKIRKRLSTRHLQKEESGYQLCHDEAKGQIGYGGVIIDGVFISFEQLNEIIQTYEGFYIEIKIKSLDEE